MGELDTDLPPDEPGEVPAAPGSALGSLRERREKAVQELYTDRVVPRLPGPVFVRYKPVPQRRIEAANKQAAASKDKDRDVISNAAVLAEACLGVFEVIDGVEVSVDDRDRDGEWPKFDSRLAEVLGVKWTKAGDVVRSLYLTDGDVISAVREVVRWSGFVDEQLERDDEGN